MAHTSIPKFGKQKHPQDQFQVRVGIDFGTDGIGMSFLSGFILY